MIIDEKCKESLPQKGNRSFRVANNGSRRVAGKECFLVKIIEKSMKIRGKDCPRRVTGHSGSRTTDRGRLLGGDVFSKLPTNRDRAVYML